MWRTLESVICCAPAHWAGSWIVSVPTVTDEHHPTPLCRFCDSGASRTTHVALTEIKNPKLIAKKLSQMIRSVKRPVVPNLVQIHPRGPPGDMCTFSNYHSFLYRYTACPEKKRPKCFCNIFYKTRAILIIFGALFPQ